MIFKININKKFFKSNIYYGITEKVELIFDFLKIFFNYEQLLKDERIYSLWRIR